MDQYCNPLAEVSLESISAQLDEIIDKVQKMLMIKNASHPSLRASPGGSGATHTHTHIHLLHVSIHKAHTHAHSQADCSCCLRRLDRLRL